MEKKRVRKPMMFGFVVTAVLVILSSAAFACTVFKGTMTLTVNGSSGLGNPAAAGTSTAIGNNSGMGWCTPPTANAQVDGIVAPATANDPPPDDAYVQVEIAITPTTGAGSCNSQLQGTYIVSWHPNFAIDCMAQVGGTPAYVDPKPLNVNSAGNSTGTAADRTYLFPAVGYGPAPSGKYAGVCVTNPLASPFDGNRAPIRVLGGNDEQTIAARNCTPADIGGGYNCIDYNGKTYYCEDFIPTGLGGGIGYRCRPT